MSPHRKTALIEKKCTCCKEVKPLSEFYRDVHRGDGYYTKCKKCHAKFVKRWQEENAEKFRSDNKKWKQAHPRQHAEESKKWKQTHPEHRSAYQKKWSVEHPDYEKIWRRNNKEKIRNYELTRRARIAGNGGELTVDEWNEILDFYGHKCLCCGRDDVKLTIDHVIPIFHSGTHTADNIQPLCGPCNSRKKDKTIDYRKEKFHAPSSD